MEKSVDDSDLVPYLCWKGKADCCRGGKVFMTTEEVINIAQSLPLEQRKEFIRRLDQHVDFSIYEQGEACQFLDAENFCTLHDKKLKPVECGWWPLHAYVEGDKVVIRISTCECGKHISEESVTLVKKGIQKVGEDRIRRFRKIYAGEDPTRPL